MLGDALALFDFIREEVDNNQIIQAHFSWDGTRISGDENISVGLTANIKENKIWFYHINKFENYIFVPVPVNPMVYTNYGVQTGEKNPTTEFFRFVSSPLSKFVSGGEENLLTDFFVFGYLPDSLMKLRKHTS